MKDSQELTVNELTDLLSTLIPKPQALRTCSKTRFCREHKELLKTVRMTKQPLALTGEEGYVTAIILDPQGYYDLERRRKRLADLLCGIPDPPTGIQRLTATKATAINPLAECFQQAEKLRAEIDRLETRQEEHQSRFINPLIAKKDVAQKALAKVEEEKCHLLEEWDKFRSSQVKTKKES